MSSREKDFSHQGKKGGSDSATDLLRLAKWKGTELSVVGLLLEAIEEELIFSKNFT